MAATRVSPGVYLVNGKRVQAKTAAEAEKIAGGQKPGGGQKQPPAQKPVNPVKVGKIKNVQTGLNAERKVADYEADQNVRYNNPNQRNAFGSRDVTFDENGNPVVTDSLSAGQQGIVDRDTQFSTRARDYANSLMQGSGLDQAFNPQVDARVGTGDMIADRRAQQQELESYMGRDIDTQYAKQKDALDQAMYNKGIPPNPQNPEYKAQLQALDDNFARQRGDIRAQALQFGGSEMERTGAMNEQRIANQFSQAQGTRNQRIGEVGTWSGAGTGAMIPNFGPYQAAGYDMGNPMDIYAAINAVKQGNRDLRIKQQAVNSSGGGGGGGGGGAPPSPFVDGPPPV